MELQPDTQEGFYEVAWEARRQLIEKWCAERPTNPLRVLKKLESHEARYMLILDRVGRKGEILFSGKYAWSARHLDKAALLPTGVPPFVEVAIRDRAVMVPSYADMAGAPARWIADHCQGRAYDAIVELGSGLGRNLFATYYYGGPPGPYHACEFTESGRRTTELLASLDSGMNVATHAFDHKAPDLSFLAGAKKALIFSVHSIEQVNRLPADYFDVLAAAADEVTGMHFEPFGFQLGGANKIAADHRVLFESRGWNVDLLERLREADGRGAIRMTFLSDNLFSNSVENPTSVAIWEAKRRRGSSG